MACSSKQTRQINNTGHRNIKTSSSKEQNDDPSLPNKKNNRKKIKMKKIK